MIGDVITHMMGYLKPGQWADAYKQAEETQRKELVKLMVEQEDAYSTNTVAEVSEHIRYGGEYGSGDEELADDLIERVGK